jgi:hypothetical protein
MLFGFGRVVRVREHRARQVAVVTAAHHGQAARVKALLASGVNANVRDHAGWTAVMHSVYSGDPETTRVLLTAGADPDAGGDTALVRGRFIDEDGSDRPAIDVLAQSTTSILHPALLDEDASNWTPLMVAIKLNHFECARELVRAGANVNGRSQSLYIVSPLHLAVESNSTRTVRLLLQHGANANVQTSDGTTPWRLARKLGNRELESLLRAALGKG